MNENTKMVVNEATGGRKGQKIARFDLIPPKAHRALAVVFGAGATKYDDDNWRKGYNWRLSVGALERHLNLWLSGEQYDAELSELAGEPVSHLAAVAWHSYCLQTFETEGLGYDDLPDHQPIPQQVVRGGQQARSHVAEILRTGAWKDEPWLAEALAESGLLELEDPEEDRPPVPPGWRHTGEYRVPVVGAEYWASVQGPADPYPKRSGLMMEVDDGKRWIIERAPAAGVPIHTRTVEEGWQ